MQQYEACKLASFREKHKPKRLTHKQWAAVHTRIKGWHVALIDKTEALATGKAQP